MGTKGVGGRLIFLRTAFVVGLGSVVAAIIYWTPFPDQSPQSCIRDCHELDWPRICRVKMVLEKMPCVQDNCQQRSTVNRVHPGPALQVCENDIVVVDVANKLTGQSLSIHWRGQALKETPLMDGASMITQCPILPSTTFQYKFRAAQAGSHFWHAAADDGLSDQLFGAFIVKRPHRLEELGSLYDNDDHVLIVQVQKGQLTLHDHHLKESLIQGRRYRFRLLFAGKSTGCRVTITANDTPLHVTALDGHSITPVWAASLEIGYGERADFILHATSETGFCSIRVEANKKHADIGPVTVDFRIKPDNKTIVKPDASRLAKVRTIVDTDCDENLSTCLNNLRGSQDLPQQLLDSTPDHKIFLFFGITSVTNDSNATVIVSDGSGRLGSPHINNRTMISPPSPLMTQIENIKDNILCENACHFDAICECVHIVHIPLDHTVELVLAHQGGGAGPFSFHFHGNSFYILNSTVLPGYPSTEEVINLDKEGRFLNKNFEKPLLKDTIVLDDRGAAVLRFQAINPGYWLFDQELLPKGMQLVFQVGESTDLPETPRHYPRCGDWVGPEFFLT